MFSLAACCKGCGSAGGVWWWGWVVAGCWQDSTTMVAKAWCVLEHSQLWDFLFVPVLAGLTKVPGLCQSALWHPPGWGGRCRCRSYTEGAGMPTMCAGARKSQPPYTRWLHALCIPPRGCIDCIRSVSIQSPLWKSRVGQNVSTEVVLSFQTFLGKYKRRMGVGNSLREPGDAVSQ